VWALNRAGDWRRRHSNRHPASTGQARGNIPSARYGTQGRKPFKCPGLDFSCRGFIQNSVSKSRKTHEPESGQIIMSPVGKEGRGRITMCTFTGGGKTCRPRRVSWKRKKGRGARRCAQTLVEAKKEGDRTEQDNYN